MTRSAPHSIAVHALLLAAVTTIATLAGLTTPARGAHSGTTEAAMGDIAQHQARGGGAAIPGVSCDARCADWWVQEHRPIPGQPTSEQMWRDLRTTRAKHVNVLPKLRVLGNIGLAAEVFHLGWKIGTGLNTKFLKVGLDASPLTGNYTTPEIHFRSAGQTSQLWYQIPMPEDGWAWSTYSRNYSYQRSVEYWSPENPRCPTAGPPPSGFTVIEGPLGYYCDSVVPIHRRLAYKPENALAAPRPIEDYTNQPYDRQTSTWPDAPTSRDQLEQRTRNALHSGEFPDLHEWYDSLLERPGSCDPYVSEPCGDTARKSDRACDLNSGISRDPASTSDRFAIHTPMTRKHDDGSTVNTALRYGWTWKAADGDWQGWGYRHIAAEHGWGPDEAAATEAALSLAPVVNGATYEYTGPEYQWNGAICVRRVVVQTNQRSYEPTAREIITSYGRRVG